MAVEGFANPEVEFRFLFRRCGGEEFLGDELFGGSAAVDAQEVRLGDEFGVDAQGGVEEADVQESEFDEAWICLCGKGQALSGRVGDLTDDTGFFQST